MDEYETNMSLVAFWERVVAWTQYVFAKGSCEECQQLHKKNQTEWDKLVASKTVCEEELHFFILLSAFIDLTQSTKLDIDYSYQAVECLTNSEWNWSAKSENSFEGYVRYLEDYLEKGQQRLELLFYRFGTN